MAGEDRGRGVGVGFAAHASDDGEPMKYSMARPPATSPACACGGGAGGGGSEGGEDSGGSGSRGEQWKAVGAVKSIGVQGLRGFAWPARA